LWRRVREWSPECESLVTPSSASPRLFHLPRFRRDLSSLAHSFSSKACQINNECCEFLPWLQQKAGAEISSVLSVGNSAFGRSLYASKAIQAGDCMLKVPYSVHLTSDKFPSKISPFIDHGVGSVSFVAVVLMAEQKLEMIFWSDDDLQMISQSPVYKETFEHKANIEKEFLALKPALECFPQIFGDLRLENFMHACALGKLQLHLAIIAMSKVLSSRAWKTSKGVSLISFADFLNHDGTSDSVLLSDDYKEISEVLADRDYGVGELVMIRYGKFSNATLLLDFGFTVPNNIYDQVQLWMDVPSHDPLYAAKIELLNKHRFPRGKKSDGFNDARGPFIIKNSYWVDELLMTEVKSAEGKGKGIPQALRAFARVLSATSVKEPEEMALEAAENDGRLARRPLKNREREVHAHRTLLFQVERMVRDHDAAIKVLQSSAVSDGDTTLFVRRGMARDLLNGGLHVLRSAHTWLANYCAAIC
ncbi:(Fructose-bisphosphate aldolase)-lysine N-methyltransferase, chloroplastic, partial [Ananas comosus]